MKTFPGLFLVVLNFVLTHALWIGGCECVVADDSLTNAQIEFFESKIRPVLIEKCYACHNSSKSADGSLALDDRVGLLRGGESGPIVVPGKPQESRLLTILRHEVQGLKMPQGGGRLNDSVIADFEKWIAMGAPDPRDKPPSESELNQSTSWESTFSKRKTWWSFQPVLKPGLPDVKDPSWSTNPVDRFILDAMQHQGLEPATPQDRIGLLRRVSFVLTGLPPTPEELRSFCEDENPNAWERVIDRLLDSPRFGEHWARHWMDLVRYCESHGSQGDPELSEAYRYRDYLIRALNSDVPYDQFVREQLAGDLLSHPRWNAEEGFNESSIGPAQLRMVELGYVPVDALEDQVKVVDNQIDVYSKAFQGLTISCARCHNHKFDPISQEDFYALYGVFASCRPGQVLIDSPDILGKNRTELTELKEAIRNELATAWIANAASFADQLRQQSQREKQLAELTKEATKIDAEIAAIVNPARESILRERGKVTNTSIPMPDACWSFEEDARDRVGSHHGQLLNGAIIRNGRLVLDGVGANMRTEPLDRDIDEKTLEAWVALTHLDQRGGGVIGLETPEGQFFDSIVFGEQNPKHWMAGSDFFRRTQDVVGPPENATSNELVHVAIVYKKDHSIQLFRNGVPYGAPYVKGTLQPFIKGKSRFLFGQRLSGINPSLAGEVDEARVYARPLSPEEVKASFDAGTMSVSSQEIEASLRIEQQHKLSSLREQQSRLRSQRTALASDESNFVAWNTVLEDAQSNRANPFHVWKRFAAETLSREELDAQWVQLQTYWKNELQSRKDHRQKHFSTVWDLRTEQHRKWFRYGTGLNSEPTPNGEFQIEPEGDHIIRGLHFAGLFSQLLSSRHTGVFGSPRFLIETNNVFVRAMGKGSMARVVIENYPIGNGGIYPASRLDRDELGWIRIDTEYRKGSQAYFEFATDPSERASFGVAEICTSDQAEVPRELTVPIQSLLHGTAPTSLRQVEELIAERLQIAVDHWRVKNISDEETALLNFFLRRDLLPTTLDRLPTVRDLVAQYRQLEKEIPVPRRAPGVLETEPFDQRLFERGVHTRPGPSISRRGLTLLQSSQYSNANSGRLSLAEETASPANPLTARVAVNRLWYHVFGRGIVSTVDNFGHLGERPSHPELLDYLAADFVEQNWSIKRMLKQMLTTQAFQQSSLASDKARQLDPSNIYLSHMRVRRLEAETIRDNILSATGQLDLKMYGPGVNVYYTTKTEGGGPKGPLDGDRRRSVYLRIRRNAHNPFLEAFDAPKPSTTRGIRDSTNVPLQSLTMLNDPFVIDQAAKWSKQLVATSTDQAEIIKTLYIRALGREPSPIESQATREYINDLNIEHAGTSDEKTRLELIYQDVVHAIFCLKEFIYVH